MSRLVFDEKLVAQLEELYATRDVLRRRRLIREALDVKAGERILDVGCGPGFYVAELLDEVGPNGSIVGLDASATMLAVAAKRSEGKPNVAFLEADATALPVGDGEFDAALCVQVLEYVPDATAALRELHRALRPGGTSARLGRRLGDRVVALVRSGAHGARARSVGRSPGAPLAPAHAGTKDARGWLRGSRGGGSYLRYG